MDRRRLRTHCFNTKPALPSAKNSVFDREFDRLREIINIKRSGSATIITTVEVIEITFKFSTSYHTYIFA